MAATFRVTSSQIIKTAAERRLPSTDSVLTLLKWIERHFSKRLPRDMHINGANTYHKALTEEMKIPLSLPSDGLTVRSPDSPEKSNK
ncbi:alpha,alpha-trehalose-phosphate synthase (UDP-forming) [Homalodisca vitripennis]|nr:alpha,alpha-trehalose-phosphate synthase (UDP-forming) [Homalodisca vitripennis]